MTTDEIKTFVYSRDSLEFVTVATGFCSYMEEAEGKKRGEFAETVLKLLPMVYLKAAVLQVDGDGDYFSPEPFVTEDEYEQVRQTVARLMGDGDNYPDLYRDAMSYGEETVIKSISEGLADIYQLLRDMVESYRTRVEQSMYEAIVAVKTAFADEWGQTLADTLCALHRFKYRPDALDDDLD